jgi:hypothetical protein
MKITEQQGRNAVGHSGSQACQETQRIASKNAGGAAAIVVSRYNERHAVVVAVEYFLRRGGLCPISEGWWI